MDVELPAARLRWLLAELARAMLLLEKSESGCCGVSLSQCHLLLEVFRRGGEGAAVGELALALSLDPSTVSRVADGLVRQGLLGREEDDRDRRRVVLVLTAKGRGLVESINLQMEAYAREVLAFIPPQERVRVLESLELLVEALRKVKGRCCDAR